MTSASPRRGSSNVICAGTQQDFAEAARAGLDGAQTRLLDEAMARAAIAAYEQLSTAPWTLGFSSLLLLIFVLFLLVAPPNKTGAYWRRGRAMRPTGLGNALGRRVSAPVIRPSAGSGSWAS